MYQRALRKSSTPPLALHRHRYLIALPVETACGPGRSATAASIASMHSIDVAGDALTNEPGQLIKDVASLLALSVLLARELFAVIVEVEDLLLVLRVHTLGATIGSKHALNRGAGVGLIPIDLQIACCAENFGEIEPAQLLLGKGFVTPALQMLTKLVLFV